MLRNVWLMLAITGLASVVFVSGCGESAQLNMKFAPQDSTSYKVSSAVIKDFRFEQPNLDKLREEQTRTEVDMTLTQTIESVDDNGVATARITIDDLKMEMVNKNDLRFAFDSKKEEDKDAPLAKLIGQSYTIKVTPTGTVKVVDASEAIKSVTASYEKKIARNLLNKTNIKQRHEIAALPKEKTQALSVNSTWSEIVASPPGSLNPKSYKKTYTLNSIESDVASVSMKGTESGEQAEDQGQSAAGGMGMFANVFDNVDDYTGSMKIDVSSGKILHFDEKFISTYTAQEMPRNGDPEKGPDLLTMKFTHHIHLEKLN